ncbi:ubiquitin fusion degradation protein 1 [Tanacetum coccineum]|uniref:Ubiquitin fusion degradation protein 1 n=1 Tax=Tanacetum coccineum TaxID=301880 RepID=A0ABQ4X7Y1_9ASTR
MFSRRYPDNNTQDYKAVIRSLLVACPIYECFVSVESPVEENSAVATTCDETVYKCVESAKRIHQPGKKKLVTASRELHEWTCVLERNPHLEAGNKIISCPASSAVVDKTGFCVTFRIATSTLHYHCGVAEFTADEGFVFLPMWMMKKLKIRECDIVNIQNKCLPEGNYIKVQPNTTKFIALSDHKLLLKKTLRDNFTCLTTNDTVVVNHNHNKYLIHIVETKPSRVISLNDTDDYEVEFVTPLDCYKQPHRAILQEDEWMKKFKPFKGDDQQVLQYYSVYMFF